MPGRCCVCAPLSCRAADAPLVCCIADKWADYASCATGPVEPTLFIPMKTPLSKVNATAACVCTMPWRLFDSGSRHVRVLLTLMHHPRRCWWKGGSRTSRLHTHGPSHTCWPPRRPREGKWGSSWTSATTTRCTQRTSLRRWNTSTSSSWPRSAAMYRVDVPFCSPLHCVQQQCCHMQPPALPSRFVILCRLLWRADASLSGDG